MRLDGIADFSQVCGDDLCTGKALREIGVNAVDLLRSMRTAIVAAYHHRDGEI